MLDIQELNDIICQDLPRRDLLSCSQVSKQWNCVVAPYLWKDITGIRTDESRLAFRTIILEDYIQGKHHHYSPSLLSKYLYYIKKIPRPPEFLDYFRYRLQHPTSQPQQILNNQDESSSIETIDLLHHFLNRCPNIAVDNLMLNWEILNNLMLLELTKEYYLPLAQQLEIGSMYFENYQIQAQESKKMKNILGRCSNKLKKLIVDCEIYSRDDGDNAEEDRGQEHGQAESTFKLEELTLRRCSITDKENNLWLWLWRRCDSLKRIGIGGAVSPVESLSKVMSTRMPNLCKIQLGVDSGNYHDSSLCMPDEKSATLVSGCRNGWKEIEINDTVGFYEASKSALVKHYPTLQVLTALHVNFTSEELMQLLSSAPNLQVLDNIYDGLGRLENFSQIDANMFVDLDPDSGLHKPWACESTLEVFKIRIGGMPRPDIGEEYEPIKESYPSESHRIQSRVYERLARFERLKVLWLGYSLGDPWNNRKAVSGDEQIDCLEMSLESGLNILGGLKELRELSISGMNTRMGLEEAEWIAGNWPELCDKPVGRSRWRDRWRQKGRRMKRSQG